MFAESWGGDAPANPFSDVSDGAIEYFVEWSIEQSIGPRALPQAHFSDVPMALPGQSGTHWLYNPPSRKSQLLRFAAVFAVGATLGAVVVALVKRPRRAAGARRRRRRAADCRRCRARRHAARAAHGGDAELVITTRPPGATVTIDGERAGETPLQPTSAPATTTSPSPRSATSPPAPTPTRPARSPSICIARRRRCT